MQGCRKPASLNYVLPHWALPVSFLNAHALRATVQAENKLPLLQYVMIPLAMHLALGASLLCSKQG
jgi:hypothetical protein